MGVKTKEMKSLSLEQMHQLKELGVDVKPKGMCLMYTSDSSDNYYLKYGESTCEDDVAAFGLQDLIELLPKSIIINSLNHWFCVNQNCLLTEFQVMYFDGDDSYVIIKQNKSLLQASYEMLLWVIENGYLKTK